jgi:hypothetical protein
VDATPLRFCVEEFDNEGEPLPGGGGDSRPCEIDHIDEGEAIAMKYALRRVSDPNAILVVGGDNTSVSRGFWRGYSTSEIIQRHIEPAACKVIFVDIPSRENYADIGTRPDEAYTSYDVEHRRSRSHDRLVEAWKEWQRWPRTYFDRRDPIFTRFGVDAGEAVPPADEDGEVIPEGLTTI